MAGSSLAQVSAAPHEWRSADGTLTLLFHPLTLNQLGGLEKWAQDQHLALARRAVDGLDRELAIEIIRQAMAEVRSPAFRLAKKEGGLQPYLNTAEGVVRLVRASLEKSLPDVTLDQVRGWISTDSTNRVTEWLQITGALNAGPAGKDPTPAGTTIPPTGESSSSQ